MSRSFKYLIVGLIIISSGLMAACATTPEIIPSKTPTLSLTLTPLPTFTHLPAPTFTPSATSTPTPLSPPPTEDPISFDNILREFPLKVGNTWIYSSDRYAYDYNNPNRPSESDPKVLETGVITATYRITETVVDTKIYTNYFTAKMVRETAIVASSTSLEEVANNPLLEDGIGGTKSYWYIISGTHVYRQESKLDLTTVESSWLEYILPLNKNTLWYPSGEQREEFPDIKNGPSSGLRSANGPMTMHLPAGELENCFEVLTIYLGGGDMSSFCSGIGLVSEGFDHAGTPYGAKTVLIDYKLEFP